MARPLRIEFAGALYHIASRGDRREPINEDDDDRETFLRVLAEVVERFKMMRELTLLRAITEHITRIIARSELRIWIYVNQFFT
ncbi:hypothetical protein ThidrDRAFT_4726 [Thiorhodococcus drewsii AZ1]|uniref:Transposase n=1 Tax=Thiorhodococcus drewsii AZ1 TaxID=765913 RepID=G2E8W2_9GAMM|nr:hypothetical protein ThidrDRAFT_4726 [Thiorhodococcus drewsii AZ1]